MFEWLTPQIILLLVFEVVSTLAQVFSFGGLLLGQRAQFERRMTTIDLRHQAERRADKEQWSRERDDLRSTIRVMRQVIQELKPDAHIPLIGFSQADASEIAHVREALRRHYSADEFGIFMADFGFNPDEFQNEAVISRIDRFVRTMERTGRLDELKERLVADRPEVKF